MSKPFLLAALLVGAALGTSATAHAQMTASITAISDRPSPNDATTMPLVAINAYECEIDATITLLMNGIPASQTTLDFWRGTACNDAVNRTSTTSTACTYLFSLNTGGRSMYTLEPIAFSQFDICDNEGTNHIFILSTTSERSSEAVTTFAPLDLTVDTVAPGEPSSVVVSDGDTQAHVAWAASTSTEVGQTYRVYVDTNIGGSATADGGTDVDAGDVDAGTDSTGCTSSFLAAGDVLSLDWTAPEGVYVYTITSATSFDINPSALGMAIGERGYVALASQDVARNRSGLTTGSCFTRIQTTGFWDAYQSSGGSASTCSVSRVGGVNGSAWMIVVALAVGIVLLRKRIGAAALLVGVTVLFAAAPSAHAQDTWTNDWDDNEDVASPEFFGIEARFGQYAPSVGGTTFADFFGSDKGPLWQFEFDVVLYRIPYVGTLSFGTGFGRASYAANAIDSATGQQVSGGEQTKLTLLPFSALAVLRIDVLARLLRLPFVFTGKIGEDFTYWTASTGADTDATGLSWGLRWGLQLGIELDFFDRAAARALDEEWGINHAFIFGEMFGVSGQGHALVTSATGWVAGLGFNL
ncbi:MAG: hypothetical protein IPK60_19810 [Sandaracinaceae bacterium]|nr:hypothetical protein [Sandaracinaceae bacterium]